MATTDIKNVEKIVKEILEKINVFDDSKSKNNVGKTLKSIETQLDNIDEKLSTTNNENTLSSEIINKVDALNSKIEQNAEDFIKEIQIAFENYKVNNDYLISKDSDAPDGIKDFVSIITNEMMDLKAQFEKFNTEFTDVNINTGMAISKEILSMKNYVLALNDTIDSIKNKVESFNPKEELTPEISKGVTNSVTEAINAYLNTFKTEVFSILAKISDGTKKVVEQRKLIEGLEISIGEIRESQQKNKDDIINILSTNITEGNKKLLPQILQIINSISFDDEAEEIKDGLYAVNENLAIVNKHVETGTETSSQILNQVNTVDEKLVKIDSSIDNISDRIPNPEIYKTISKIDSALNDISVEFDILTKGSKADTDSYLYTLLDLEADISKVRVILDELTHSIKDDKSLAESVSLELSEKVSKINSFIDKTAKLYSDPDYKAILEQFDALNDDITSISRRTNKLILTSDDAAIKLEKNIENFQDIISNISLTVSKFENSKVLKTLSERTANIQKLAKNSLLANNCINEAFIYLAGWIDNTSDELKTIKNDLSELCKSSGNIEEIKNNLIQLDKSSQNNIEEIKDKLTEVTTVNDSDNNYDMSKIEKLLEAVNKKLSENEKKINLIEQRIENAANGDVAQLLENLTKQIESLNQNITANKTLNKKIDKIEKQIQQLVSYVEVDE